MFMNKNQWYALEIGLIIFGSLLLGMASPPCLNLDGSLIIACYIRRYSYAIPGLIFIGVGIITMFLAWLEPRKMEDDAPKEHKEIVKLARLEHEVKELKDKLRKQGKIKS